MCLATLPLQHQALLFKRFNFLLNQLGLFVPQVVLLIEVGSIFVGLKGYLSMGKDSLSGGQFACVAICN